MTPEPDQGLLLWKVAFNGNTPATTRWVPVWAHSAEEAAIAFCDVQEHIFLFFDVVVIGADFGVHRYQMTGEVTIDWHAKEIQNE